MKTTIYVEKAINGYIMTFKNDRGKTIARTEEEMATEIAAIFVSSLHGVGENNKRAVFEIESRLEP